MPTILKQVKQKHSEEIKNLLIELNKAGNTVNFLTSKLKKKGIDASDYDHKIYVYVVDKDSKDHARVTLNNMLQNTALNKQIQNDKTE